MFCHHSELPVTGCYVAIGVKPLSTCKALARKGYDDWLLQAFVCIAQAPLQAEVWLAAHQVM